MANEVWTDPRTWVDGETPTGAQFNTHLRDNLKYLKQAPQLEGDLSVTGKVTATTDVVAGQDLTVARNASIGNALAVAGQFSAGGNVALGDAPSDIVQVTGTVRGAPFQTYTETRTDPAIAGGLLTLDCALGTFFRVQLNNNHSVQIINPPPVGRVVGVTLIYVGDGVQRQVTWPPQVAWASGVAPTLSSAAGRHDLITLLTDNGGSTWFGVIVGQAY